MKHIERERERERESVPGFLSFEEGSEGMEDE